MRKPLAIPPAVEMQSERRPLLPSEGLSDLRWLGLFQRNQRAYEKCIG